MTETLEGRALDREARMEVLDTVERALLSGDLSWGQALTFLRAVYLDQSRATYAGKVGLHPKTLETLERDRGNPTVDSIARAFRPFGYRLGLIRSDATVGAPPGATLPDARYAVRLAAIRAALARNPRGRR